VRLSQRDGEGDDHSRLHRNRYSDRRDHFTHASRQSQDELKIAGSILSRAVKYFSNLAAVH